MQIIAIKQCLFNFFFGTNNSSHLLATNNNSNNNNKPMLRRKSVAVIQSLPNTNKHQSFCGDSLGMPKEPRQR